jgi:hypothetical protein
MSFSWDLWQRICQALRRRERERQIHIAILPLRHNPNDGGCYTNYIVTDMDCLVRVLFKMIFITQQTKFRECLLPFGSESFVIPPAVQERKG